MKRMSLIVISLICLMASPCSQSFAGYAGLIAPASKFRVAVDLRVAQRDVQGYYMWHPLQRGFTAPFFLLRFKYGISKKVRLSGDLMEFSWVSDDENTGERRRIEYGAVGLSLQGEVWRLRRNLPVELTAGYWAVDGSASGGQTFPSASIRDRMLALTLVSEMPKSPTNRLYAGLLYSHLRWERYTDVIEVTSGLASHRNLGLVGGVDALLFHHIVLNLEGFLTGDYGGSGSLGWEF